MPDDAALRLFLAIDAPESVRLEAAQRIASLRSAGDVRWVAPERLHLTLKFLGNTPPKKVALLEECLQDIANTCLHFVLTLDRLGAFPSVRRPQTVWYGVAGETSALSELAAKIDVALAPFGFAKEGRPFRGHLTLGRVRSSRGLRDLVTELEKRAAAAPPEIDWRVDSFALIRSDLLPTGPVYTELARFPLRPPEGETGRQEQERRPDGT